MWFYGGYSEFIGAKQRILRSICGGGLLTSLFENNQDITNINVYLLTSDMSQKNRDRFLALAEQYHRTIKFLDANKIYKFCEENDLHKYHGSYAPYYKIFALSVIEEDIDRLVYLDSDMIVTGSLKYLINVDLNNNILGMCIDTVSETHKKLIGVSSTYYYNTGMIVFDVKKWLEEKCMDRFVYHITNVQANYPLSEQDIVNVILGTQIQKLPLKYNFFTELLLYNNCDFVKNVVGIKHFYSEDEFIDGQKNAVIWHCFGWMCLRPWVENTDHPAKELWNSYIQKSLWNDFVPIKQKKAFPFKVQTFLYKHLPNNIYAFVYRNISFCLQKRRVKKFGIK